MSQQDLLPGCNGGSRPVLTRKADSDKDLTDQTRVYDHDGYRLRADTICFKDTKKQEVRAIGCLSFLLHSSLHMYT